MAFCNSCGAQVDDAAAFCRSCGKPLPRASTAAPVSAGAPQPPPAVPRHEVPIDAPSTSSNVLKVVLIVFAVIVGLGILGTVAAVQVLHRVKVEQRGDRTHVETP